MGKILDFKTTTPKKVLIDAVTRNSSLKKIIEELSDDEAKKVLDSTAGSLEEVTNKLAQFGEDVAQFVKKAVEEHDSMLIINAMINYLTEFMARVPEPENPNYDIVEYTYEYTMGKEINRVIVDAIAKVRGGADK